MRTALAPYNQADPLQCQLPAVTFPWASPGPACCTGRTAWPEPGPASQAPAAWLGSFPLEVCPSVADRTFLWSPIWTPLRHGRPGMLASTPPWRRSFQRLRIRYSSAMGVTVLGKVPG